MAGEPLWPLLTFEGLEGDDLIDAYRQTYLQTYIKKANGDFPVFQDWNGDYVEFRAWQFDHAFSKTDGYRQGLDHDCFSLERAERMLWIQEVLQASKGTINRYIQTHTTNRGDKKRRRTFFVHEERYLVVLDEPRQEGGAFQFITAYPIYDHDYLQRIKQRSVLVECRKGGGK